MQCNKCGVIIEIQDRKQTVEAVWGYYSINKDTLQDKWNLCAACVDKLSSIAVPVCSFCHNTIADVMAALHTRYVESEAEKALEFKRMRTCIKDFSVEGCWEIVKIGDLTMCEICYEAYTQDFKVPMKVVCYAHHSFKLSLEEFRTRLKDDPNLPENRKKKNV